MKINKNSADATPGQLGYVAVTHRRSQLNVLEKLGLFLVVIAILYTRMPARLHFGYLWAEDGVIFIRQAYHLGIWSVFQPYAGYVHVVPRIITWILVEVVKPLSLIKLFPRLAALVTAVGCVYVASAASKWVPKSVALLFGLVPVFIKNDGEVWLCLVNLQWVLAPIVAMMIFEVERASYCTPKGSLQSAFRAVILLLLMLTGPFGFLFGMLAILSLGSQFKQGNKIWTPEVIALIAGVVIQGGVIIFCPQQYKVSPHYHFLDFLNFHWGRGVREFVLQDLFAIQNQSLTSGFAGRVLFLLIALATICMGVTLANKSRLLFAVGLGFALLFWVLGVIRSDTIDLHVGQMMSANRYTYVPYVLIAWCLLVVMCEHKWSMFRVLAALFLSLMFLKSVERWSCDMWTTTVVNLPQGGYLLKIPPGPDWEITVPASPGRP